MVQPDCRFDIPVRSDAVGLVPLDGKLQCTQEFRGPSPSAACADGRCRLRDARGDIYSPFVRVGNRRERVKRGDYRRPPGADDLPTVAARISVQEIVTRPSGERTAIINDAPHEVGDKVGGAEIERIEPDGVRFGFDGQSFFKHVR
ncbi:MAG: hypothetical protein HY928_06140 [Elusimicrobia bacterium]|nr:hypothetical protein [Elusimicrobiota bacterium]